MITAGGWTIEVTRLEAIVLTVTLTVDGDVSGTCAYDDETGPVEGSWRYDAPVLVLRLEALVGASPRPLDYEVVLSGGTPLRGTDTDGHHFTLRPGE